MTRDTVADRQINTPPIKMGMRIPYWIVGTRSEAA